MQYKTSFCSPTPRHVRVFNNQVTWKPKTTTEGQWKGPTRLTETKWFSWSSVKFKIDSLPLKFVISNQFEWAEGSQSQIKWPLYHVRSTLALLTFLFARKYRKLLAPISCELGGFSSQFINRKPISFPYLSSSSFLVSSFSAIPSFQTSLF